MIASVREWFANAYGDDSSRVLRSLSRTAGVLFEFASDRGTYWLRAGGIPRRSESEVEVEGRVATELATSGVKIARPRARADGRFAGSMFIAGERVPAIAYQEVHGEQVELPTRAQATRLGEAVGRLHASRIGAEGLPIVEPVANIAMCVTATARWMDADQENWLRITIDRQSNALARLISNTRPTICHGDLRLANTRFLAESPTLFDLEGLGVGPPAYDCACMWRRRVLENGLVVPADWESFKHGYETALDVEEGHWRLVPTLAVLRAVWTMSLPALPGATWGAEWVRDPDYWRAHMRMIRWFAAAAEVGEPA